MEMSTATTNDRPAGNGHRGTGDRFALALADWVIDHPWITLVLSLLLTLGAASGGMIVGEAVKAGFGNSPGAAWVGGPAGAAQAQAGRLRQAEEGGLDAGDVVGVGAELVPQAHGDGVLHLGPLLKWRDRLLCQSAK